MNVLVVIPLLGLVWVVFHVSREAGLPVVVLGLLFLICTLFLVEDLLWIPALPALLLALFLLRRRQAGGWPLGHASSLLERITIILPGLLILFGWFFFLSDASSVFKLLEFDAPAVTYSVQSLLKLARGHLLIGIFIALAILIYLLGIILVLFEKRKAGDSGI